MKIGANQRQELDVLRKAFDSLEKVLDGEMRKDLAPLRQRLEDWAARVVVIGQVKAGKSTLLNALLGRPNLLPSDTNPWTSVVTDIRINLAQDPQSGVRFDFHSESDLHEIEASNSPRRQSEGSHDRAQKRLGLHYDALLGNHHAYDALTPDLLRRYLCADQDRAAGPREEAQGRDAPRTKLVNLYMRLPDFRVPTILTDTPGVNAAFLLRDKFTCRSLGHWDLYLMVLSAQHPLTEVDIALLHSLAKQGAKDVVIFLNRIDALDDYCLDVQRVLEDVTRRLRKAMPGIDFHILAGSAHLAELALRRDAAAEIARAAADTPELAAYVRGKYGFVPADPAKRLLLASGIDNVKMILSDLIDGGLGHRQLKELTTDLRAQLNSAHLSTQRERDTLRLQAESVRPEVAEWVIVELESELRSLRDIRERLAGHAASAEAQIEKIIAKSSSALLAKIMNFIDLFFDDQKGHLEERIKQVRRGWAGVKEFEIDLAPLQRQLEGAVLQAFQRSRAGIDVCLNTCLHASLQTMKQRFGNPAKTITLADLPHEDFKPTLPLSRRMLRVGLGSDRRWAFWRDQRANTDASLASLRNMVVEELRPAVEMALSAFSEAQSERAGAGAARIRNMLRMFERKLAEEVDRLRRDKAEMEAVARDHEVRRAMVRRIHSKIEGLERRLQNLAAIEQALSRSGLNLAA